jgi:hypothetical protein
VDNPKVVPIELEICRLRRKTAEELQRDREEREKLRHPYEKIVEQLGMLEEPPFKH